MKQLISRRSFMKAAGVTTAVAAVSLGAPAASACFPGSVKDITILYTNDVHTYIDKKSPELTYAAIAALKKSYQDAGKDVLLVDAGDHIQGTAYGSMDEGASIIQLMNAAGYDVATPGNHEFDYGMARAKEAMAEADFPYLSSNWVNLPLGNRVLPDVKYFTIGGRVIAFVGITTPETFTKSTPAYFMDKSQKRYIYDILGGDDGQKLYKAVQKSIDKAKLLADYVIGLGHLGVDPSSSPWTSREVIQHTSGLDAFIDGHSHTKMECEWVKDLSGKAVALTQTGSYFANVGEMTIKTDGSIATRLISSYEGSDSVVEGIQTAWVASVDDMLGEKIAASEINFYVTDPETGNRRIRTAETNLGDFVADTRYRWSRSPMTSQPFLEVALAHPASFSRSSARTRAGSALVISVKSNGAGLRSSSPDWIFAASSMRLTMRDRRLVSSAMMLQVLVALVEREWCRRSCRPQSRRWSSSGS